MSPPPPPSFVASTLAVARLSVRRMIRGRKLYVALVAAIVVILFPGIVALLLPNAAPGHEEELAVSIVTTGINLAFFNLLIFLLPILLASGVIGEEIEARTIHYLTVRPSNRSAIALGKYLVSTGTALAILWVALILLHIFGYMLHPSSMIDQLGETAQAGGAASLLVMAYCGVCLTWSALFPQGAGMISFVWLGFVEYFLAKVPYLRFLSLNHFGRQLGGLEMAGFFDEEIPELALWTCALILVGGWLLYTSIGVLWVQFSELRFGKA